jgi:membrane-associated protease RseP (regulator of RpoE activity)
MVPVTFVRNGKQDETRVKAQRSSFHQTAPPNTALVDPPVDKELYQKGAREKDEIAEVDGKVMTSRDQVDADLRGKPGKAVTLKLRRRDPKFEDDQKLIEVRLEPLKSKKWFVIEQDENVLEPRVGMVFDNRPAAGSLEPGDLIQKIGDREIRSWAELKEVVENATKAVEFHVQRDSESKSFTITPMKKEDGKGGIGITPKVGNVFSVVKEGSYFARMGLESGDRLVSIDGHGGDVTLGGLESAKIPPVMGVREEQEKTIKIEVERKGKRLKIDLIAEPKEEADLAAAGFKTNRGWIITAESFPFRRRPFGEAVKIGLQEPVDIIVMTIDILKKLVTGGESAKGLSGPIGIIRASYGFAQRNIGNFIWLLCLITVNLGIFNLLPIPILDGGHNVLLLIEVVRKWFGKPPPSERFIAAFQYVGLAFILTLFVFVTYNDLSNMFGFGRG